MKRKLLCSLGALLLVLAISGRAEAAQTGGSIQVNLPGAAGEIGLFRVGSWSQEGFVLEESCGGGFIKAEDIHSSALAQWLAESGAGEGRCRMLGKDGSVFYSAVPEGLYLVSMTGERPEERAVAPFLLAMPYDGTWELEVNPRMEILPPTGQGPEPFLGAAGMAVSGLGLLACCRRRKRYF